MALPFPNPVLPADWPTWARPGGAYQYVTNPRPANLPHDFGGNLANWLAKAGYGIPYRPSVEYADEVRGGPQLSAVGAASPQGRVFFSPKWQGAITGLASQYGTRGKPLPGGSEPLRLALHELLHQSMAQREPDFYDKADDNWRMWEEAAVEQGARDLMAPAMKQLFNLRFDPSTYKGEPEYAARQKAYRQLSVFGSGAKNDQGRKARVWRRKFVNASSDDRKSMYDAAMAARQAWGARTGR